MSLEPEKPTQRTMPELTDMVSIKLTQYGAAANEIPMSTEDARSAELARRAQQGDYDDGKNYSISPLSGEG